MGTWHVPFPLFVVGRRMNFSVGICALSSVYGDLRNVCTFVSVSVCLPVRVAAAPVNPFRSLPIDFVDSSSVDLPFFAGIFL